MGESTSTLFEEIVESFERWGWVAEPDDVEPAIRREIVRTVANGDGRFLQALCNYHRSAAEECVMRRRLDAALWHIRRWHYYEAEVYKATKNGLIRVEENVLEAIPM